ncbi:hypothetical protein ACRB8A_19330 (plasmid) [Arthrobacter sp. G.S.26]|uniref:hypothetical protein n=1 Tax=Arthrobacter sp. G.S.26 TaxID=3433706 RepID=UPI003D76F107
MEPQQGAASPVIGDWNQLKGTYVEIHVKGKIRDMGWVDCVAEDGSILWLAMDGAANRRLIEKQSDIRVLDGAEISR